MPQTTGTPKDSPDDKKKEVKPITGSGNFTVSLDDKEVFGGKSPQPLGKIPQKTIDAIKKAKCTHLQQHEVTNDNEKCLTFYFYNDDDAKKNPKINFRFYPGPTSGPTYDMKEVIRKMENFEWDYQSEATGELKFLNVISAHIKNEKVRNHFKTVLDGAKLEALSKKLDGFAKSFTIVTYVGYQRGDKLASHIILENVQPTKRFQHHHSMVHKDLSVSDITEILL